MADQVRLAISERVVDRIANACLRREMDHCVHRAEAGNGIEGIVFCDIDGMKGKAFAL